MAWVGGTASMTQLCNRWISIVWRRQALLVVRLLFAKIVGTFGAAWLAVKFGVKMAFFVASILIAVGLFTPYSPNYEVLLLTRFLMGLGGAL